MDKTLEQKLHQSGCMDGNKAHAKYIKTTRYHYMPDDTKCSKRNEATETLIYWWWQTKTATLQNNLAVSYRVKNTLTVTQQFHS